MFLSTVSKVMWMGFTTSCWDYCVSPLQNSWNFSKKKETFLDPSHITPNLTPYFITEYKAFNFYLWWSFYFILLYDCFILYSYTIIIFTLKILTFFFFFQNRSIYSTQLNCTLYQMKFDFSFTGLQEKIVFYSKRNNNILSYLRI